MPVKYTMATPLLFLCAFYVLSLTSLSALCAIKIVMYTQTAGALFALFARE